MTINDWLYTAFAILLIPYIVIGLYGFLLSRFFIFKVKVENPVVWEELGHPNSLGSNVAASLKISKYFTSNGFSGLSNNPELLRWAKIIRFCNFAMFILTPLIFAIFISAIFL